MRIVLNIHIPVLAKETINALSLQKEGVYVDATFGRGGHSQLILNALEDGKLIAFDQDEQAISYGKETFLSEKRLTLVHDNFSNMKTHLDKMGIGEVDGIVMDIGVSSPQLDEAERGFSFMREGPLDMRMDRSSGISAYQYLLKVSEVDLVEALQVYGEERYARRIAKAIVKARSDQKLKDSTLSLVEIVKGSGIRYEKHKHPATRTFQAIRMVVNREAEVLESGLESALQCLKVGGRLAVISFHGLEHRIVKNFIRKHRGKDGDLRFLEKISVGFWERRENPRARSAYLRVMERSR